MFVEVQLQSLSLTWPLFIQGITALRSMRIEQCAYSDMRQALMHQRITSTLHPVLGSSSVITSGQLPVSHPSPIPLFRYYIRYTFDKIRTLTKPTTWYYNLYTSWKNFGFPNEIKDFLYHIWYASGHMKIIRTKTIFITFRCQNWYTSSHMTVFRLNQRLLIHFRCHIC